MTGLGNERAYALDLRREVARAARHGRPLTVARVEVAGLDLAVGGDEVLRQVGIALGAIAGPEVHAYRVGLVQFALLLPDAVPIDAGFVLGPLGEARVVDVSVGLATHPADPLDELDLLARRRRADGAIRSRQRVGHQDRPDL